MNLKFYEENAAPEFVELLHRLDQGNHRFKNNKTIQHDFAGERMKLLDGQKPFAIVLTCSDSRVVPNYIFDAKMGEFFVIRTAGNVIDDVALGSIEYAVSHLNCKLLMILGHQFCGAVTAAVQGGSTSKYIEKTLDHLKHAVHSVKDKNYEHHEAVDEIVIQNVKNQMKKALDQSEVIRKYHEESKILVVGAYYSLETGDIDFI